MGRNQGNNLRYFGTMGALVAAIGLACYPIIIAPMNNPKPWRDLSKKIREDNHIEQDKIQPGGMQPWTDPFDRPGKPGNK